MLRRSDGPQPHHITLQFMKKALIQICRLRISASRKSACLQSPRVQKLAINLNILADDTPVKLLIKAGTSLYDLQDVKTVTMDKPTGWITFEVGAKQS